MNILPVNTSRDLKKFIAFPYALYKNDPVWIPPLRSEQKAMFNPESNPFMRHCEWQFYLLKDGGRIIGRIAAFIDAIAIDFWKERIGFFGYFECIEHASAAKLLLDAAMTWLQKQACTRMRGPWSFVAQEFGMVEKGFDTSPVIMAPSNPPYYNILLENYGFRKAKDLLCWSISIADGYRIPERIITATDKIAERFGISLRQLNMKEYDNEILNIIEVSNSSLVENWGYTPVTEAEVNAMAKDMKRIIQPKGVLFAEDRKGRLIGFAIVLPDINSLLKGLNGRMLPFGFMKLLWGIPRLRKYRMFALGVIPEYQRKGVDSLIYRALHEFLHAEDLEIEIDYVLEDNLPMINAIHKLGAIPSRRYRVYEMDI